MPSPRVLYCLFDDWRGRGRGRTRQWRCAPRTVLRETARYFWVEEIGYPGGRRVDKFADPDTSRSSYAGVFGHSPEACWRRYLTDARTHRAGLLARADEELADILRAETALRTLGVSP